MTREFKKSALMIAGILSVVASVSYGQEGDSSHAALRAAFEACATEVGLPKPEQGQRPQAPDEEQRQKMDACMKEKGFDPPAHRRGPHGPPPPPEGASGSEDQGRGGVQ